MLNKITREIKIKLNKVKFYNEIAENGDRETKIENRMF